MSNLDKISIAFYTKINAVKNKEELQSVKTELFGKNGEITTQFKYLGSLDPVKEKNYHLN